MVKIGGRFNFSGTVLGGIIVAVLLLGGMYFLLTTFTPQVGSLYLIKGSPGGGSRGSAEVVVVDLGSLGDFAKWSKVEIKLTGPDSTGMGNPNPFLIEVYVTFNGPGGETFVVPAFYDGNGNGGLDGNVWKGRFSPNDIGVWTFSTTSSEPLLNGNTGNFRVIDPTGCQPYTPGGLPGFSCLGRLQNVGRHYLRFTSGLYWLKGGQDDPEDFLAPGNTVGFPTKQAAVDYLAGKGVNSLYIMLHNVDGDGQNVWPWVGATQSQAKANHRRFDVAKLAEWEEIFSYIQEQGLVLHLVLEDDEAWTGFDRALYYREMIARFGHHNGLYWNVGEEYNENYTPRQAKQWAQMIRNLDTYDHPITIHNAGSLSNWQPFVGDDRFDLTSFQTDPSPQNAAAVSWYQTLEGSGNTIPISFDETGKLGAGDRDLVRHIVWSVYLGGANFEMHTWPLSTYGDFAEHFEDMTRARTFLEDLPFWRMRPANSLLTGGLGYVFATPGIVYAIYLPSGGVAEVDLSDADASEILEAKWFNPRSGQYTGHTTVNGGGKRSFTAPSGGDWTLLIENPSALTTYLPLVLD